MSVILSEAKNLEISGCGQSELWVLSLDSSRRSDDIHIWSTLLKSSEGLGADYRLEI